MQGYIELAGLESVLKSEELKVLRRSGRYYFWSDFESVKTQVHWISKIGLRQCTCTAQKNL